ncbi:NINE protein [Massilia yuzhufengensis]|uniref:TM2 domain-containing protein n=1 Tax=Massilia yuzhufengensis TaxID=1164594 RepID=A0A1I1TB71_9BURK|nr:NINE protein [Massilia yuzhufengensis]SFD55839.1 TM2 domain-containing protein [Massilia yuzhufengensis]
MAVRHKNKTLTTLLALLLGGFGVHRFYLKGGTDRLGLLHLCSLPVTGILWGAVHPHPFYVILPMLLSYIVGFVEGLVIGLTPDDAWDALHNKGSGKTSRSNWLLALLLVLTVGVGAIALIGMIARVFDLLYTGGSYG